jgi:hypothetical protein
MKYKSARKRAAASIIHAAGGCSGNDAAFQAYQYPVAHRLMECCDAVLRIPAESRGADLDVARARALGLPVYTDVAELPLRGNLGGPLHERG